MTLDRIAWSWTEYVIYISLRTVIVIIPVVKLFRQKKVVASCHQSSVVQRKRWVLFFPQTHYRIFFRKLCKELISFAFVIACCNVNTTHSVRKANKTHSNKMPIKPCLQNEKQDNFLSLRLVSFIHILINNVVIFWQVCQMKEKLCPVCLCFKPRINCISGYLWAT